MMTFLPTIPPHTPPPPLPSHYPPNPASTPLQLYVHKHRVDDDLVRSVAIPAADPLAEQVTPWAWRHL